MNNVHKYNYHINISVLQFLFIKLERKLSSFVNNINKTFDLTNVFYIARAINEIIRRILFRFMNCKSSKSKKVKIEVHLHDSWTRSLLLRASSIPQSLGPRRRKEPGTLGRSRISVFLPVVPSFPADKWVYRAPSHY